MPAVKRAWIHGARSLWPSSTAKGWIVGTSAKTWAGSRPNAMLRISALSGAQYTYLGVSLIAFQNPDQSDVKGTWTRQSVTAHPAWNVSVRLK